MPRYPKSRSTARGHTLEAEVPGRWLRDHPLTTSGSAAGDRSPEAARLQAAVYSALGASQASRAARRRRISRAAGSARRSRSPATSRPCCKRHRGPVPRLRVVRQVGLEIRSGIRLRCAPPERTRLRPGGRGCAPSSPRSRNTSPAFRRSRSRTPASARGSAPTIERTRMFSEHAGNAGAQAHTPRTMRSIFTPARDARYSASMACGSTSAFILAMMRAGLPSRAFCCFAFDLGEDRLVQAERRLQQAAELGRLREARELQEELVHVLPHFVGTGEKAVIRVTARRARVIVAGAEVAVAPDAARFAADHEQAASRASCSPPRRTSRARRLPAGGSKARCSLLRRSVHAARR